MRQLGYTLSLVTLLTPASGQAVDLSFGANLGIAQGETGSGEINHQLSESGLDAHASSSDDHRTAWQIRLGYAFTPNWGLELSYVDLGDVETTFSGSAADIDSFLSASSDIHPNTADGLLISGVYRHPFGSLTSLNGVVRAGAFIWSSEYRLNGITASRRVNENGTDLSFGLGLELSLDKLNEAASDFTLQLGWDRYRIDKEQIDLLSLGLSHRFSW
jgi:hypothetical protein